MVVYQDLLQFFAFEVIVHMLERDPIALKMTFLESNNFIYKE